MAGSLYPTPALARAFCHPLTTFYLENLVEARVLQYVTQVAVDPRQAQLPSGGHQPLLRLEEHPQAGARDVLQAAAVDPDRPLHFVEEGLRRRRLRRVQAPGDRHRAVRRLLNLQHRSLAPSS